MGLFMLLRRRCDTLCNTRGASDFARDLRLFLPFPMEGRSSSVLGCVRDSVFGARTKKVSKSSEVSVVLMRFAMDAELMRVVDSLGTLGSKLDSIRFSLGSEFLSRFGLEFESGGELGSSLMTPLVGGSQVEERLSVGASSAVVGGSSVDPFLSLVAAIVGVGGDSSLGPSLLYREGVAGCAASWMGGVGGDEEEASGEEGEASGLAMVSLVRLRRWERESCCGGSVGDDISLLCSAASSLPCLGPLLFAAFRRFLRCESGEGVLGCSLSLLDFEDSGEELCGEGEGEGEGLWNLLVCFLRCERGVTARPPSPAFPFWGDIDGTGSATSSAGRTGTRSSSWWREIGPCPTVPSGPTCPTLLAIFGGFVGWLWQSRK
jgi:hypothetical protein